MIVNGSSKRIKRKLQKRNRKLQRNGKKIAEEKEISDKVRSKLELREINEEKIRRAILYFTAEVDTQDSLIVTSAIANRLTKDLLTTSKTRGTVLAQNEDVVYLLKSQVISLIDEGIKSHYEKLIDLSLRTIHELMERLQVRPQFKTELGELQSSTKKRKAFTTTIPMNEMNHEYDHQITVDDNKALSKTTKKEKKKNH